MRSSRAPSQEDRWRKLVRMADQTAKLFRLLETADNFIKYARPGNHVKAGERARKRYEKAARLATEIGDDRTLELIRLRIEDIERRAMAPQSAADEPSITPEDEPDYRGIRTMPPPPHAADRVPAGQRVTRGWPVLHEGPIPRFDPATWRFSIEGEVETAIGFTYDELKALEPVEMRTDFHCVTGWSKLDNVWQGVKTRTVLGLAGPRPEAQHVTVAADHGYTANVPLDVLLQEDALLAWGHNGADLAPKHGYPLRLVIPNLYAWKSVKWVRSFELMTRDRRGFWELRGYHNRADPWREERYSYQE